MSTRGPVRRPAGRRAAAGSPPGRPAPASGCPSAPRPGPAARVSATAAAPSAASPTTTMSGWAASSAPKPCRTIAWSSAISTLIMRRCPPAGVRQRRRHRVAAVGRRPGGQRRRRAARPAPACRPARARARPAPAAPARRRSGAAVARPRTVEPVRRRSRTGDRAPAAPGRVPGRVGQRLLHDPVRGQPDRLGGTARSGRRAPVAASTAHAGPLGGRRPARAARPGRAAARSARRPSRCAARRAAGACRSARRGPPAAIGGELGPGRLGQVRSSRYGAVSACTAIIDMWCATTSCISRAIRVRSSSTARRARSSSVSSACSASCSPAAAAPATAGRRATAIGDEQHGDAERVGLVGVEERHGTMLNAAAQAVTAGVLDAAPAATSTTRKPMICTGAPRPGLGRARRGSCRGTAAGTRSARPPAGAGRRSATGSTAPTDEQPRPATARARGCPRRYCVVRRRQPDQREDAERRPGTGQIASGAAPAPGGSGRAISRRSGAQRLRARSRGRLVSISSRLRRRCRRVVPPRCRPASHTRV